MGECQNVRIVSDLRHIRPEGSVYSWVDFGVLGPLRIRTADGVVPVRAARQRTLAAALISRANKSVPIDELTEFLWDDRPPRGARGAVQAYVMRLRQALGDGARHELIRTVAGGYLLVVPPEAVDLLRFRNLVGAAERSVDAGQLAAASRQFGQALGLWRGPPFSDIESDVLRRGEISMLAEQRLLTIERRIEIELAIGHHRQVIPQLRALVSEQPLRERYWYLLMLALHQAGWRGDALAAYRRVRQILASELGVEPSEELRELHEAALLDRSAADAAGQFLHGRWAGRAAIGQMADSHAADSQPAGSQTVNGRTAGSHADNGRATSGHAADAGHDDRRLSAGRVPGHFPRDRTPRPGYLRGHLAAGHGPLVPIAQDHQSSWVRQCQLPPDIGDFVGRAAATERIAAALTRSEPTVPVAAISGLPGVGKTALATRVAHRLRGAFPDGQLYARLTQGGSRPRDVAAVLADLMLATGLCPSSIPDGLDQREAAYRSWLADRRVLIVLDDAADATQVRPLLPGTPGCAVLATSRNDLRGLIALDNALGYLLDVLAPSEALALLSRRLDAHRVAAEPAAAADLAAVCGYLPLALRIAAANLARCADRTLGSYVADLKAGNRIAKLALDSDPVAALQTSFDISYAALDPALRRLFGLLGLLQSPHFTTGDVAHLLNADEALAARLLDRLAAASLIRRQASARFEFHDLLRIYAAAKSSNPTGARHLHRGGS